MTFDPFRDSAVLTVDDPGSCDLLSYAGDRGHPEFRCLSRTQNPASCVPCTDFSPWLRERVRRHDLDALCEYLWRVRRANPGGGDTSELIERLYSDLARAVMSAPLSQYLTEGTAEAYLDLRGLDVADSGRLIIQSGLVIPAADAAAWLTGWTRRDLLGFLAQCGVRAPKSWSKERLSEVALADCPDMVRARMLESGAVELAPVHAEAAGRLGGYIQDVKETWRVWLGFGTGVEV